MALHAENLLSYAEHLNLTVLGAREQCGALWHLKHLVLVTREKHEVFQLFKQQSLVGWRYFLSQRSDGFPDVGLVQELLLQVEFLLSDIQSFGWHTDYLASSD
jgi:hypothetical protein